jgi:hypothetical protein
MTLVTTYQHAYRHDGPTIDLCRRHEDSEHPTTAEIYGPLGPVAHGRHEGYCEACEAERVAACYMRERSSGRVLVRVADTLDPYGWSWRSASESWGSQDDAIARMQEWEPIGDHDSRIADDVRARLEPVLLAARADLSAAIVELGRH